MLTKDFNYGSYIAHAKLLEGDGHVNLFLKTVRIICMAYARSKHGHNSALQKSLTFLLAT